MIKLKRIYTEPEKSDGFRILVDRLWPRGISKEYAELDLWLKEAAPSTELRKWFNHDVAKWSEFQKKYRQELIDNPAFEQLEKIVSTNAHVTLLFATKDELHNEAIVLKELLSK